MKNITSNSNFIFEPLTNSIRMYDKAAVLLDTMPYNSSEVSSVWSDDTYLYIGTTTSGITRLSMTVISNPSISGLDLTSYVQEYKSFPDITHNTVNYVHGNGDYICTATFSGIDHIKISTDDRYYTTLSGKQGVKCHQTTTGRFYYILDDDTFNAVYNNTSNWDELTVGYTYRTTADFLPISFVPTDVDVTEGTSTYNANDNVIFLAINDGALVIEERQGDELNSRFKYYLKNG